MWENFHEELHGSFGEKLLTERQTDRQTDRQRALHNVLGGHNKFPCTVTVRSAVRYQLSHCCIHTPEEWQHHAMRAV